MNKDNELKREEIEMRKDRMQVQIEPSLLQLIQQTASSKQISVGELTRFALIRAIHDLTGTIWKPKL
jgi:hypothetical protein